MTPENIIEIIMAQHWDIVACDCWICEEGRSNGLGAKHENLPHVRKDDLGFVRVDGAWMQQGNDAHGRKTETSYDSLGHGDAHGR